MRRRVPALVIVGPGLLHRHPLGAGEAVYERRLAYATRADEHCGHARLQARSERIAALTGQATDDMDGDAYRDRLDRGDLLPWVVRAVGLGQDDLGCGAALPDRDEVALDAPRLELRPERCDDEREVDVRGQRLLLRRATRRLPHDRAPSRQHGPDEAVAETDPVADGDVE